ncbi:tetratricopeptide repeat protein [Flavihumibacter profundi]|uniref:tetratricopeptide repeat protein n=1 Tax=Flavihumibacter profundi TaxID=2716883 RepID=UPI001CC4DBC8|nr:tetratricopeptide repeat protein [Flavihumibacter profundi]MBZ5859477.1 tetratricopeptide repeat protein [Flavihumibacter profundi]
MKKYLYSLVLAAVMCGNSLFAQSVDQGKKFYYYERYKSAKDAFEKTLAANPNDIVATYWLGQTLIELNDSSAAKELYQKALTTNGNAPILLVGMGHIELKEGRKEEARQRFETALSLTKYKDINIANAIGHAMTESKNGDAQYVIDKLTPITQQKGFNNPTTWLVIGDAYRKLVDGGNAVQAYQKALAIDPNNAAAKHRIGKIYMTQGNADIFIPTLQDAVKADPNYGPSYFELYYYYFNRDINKAKDYYDRYMAVTDATPANDYEKTAILFASRRYDEAISTANGNIAKLGAEADPKYYKLIAYCYDEKKDSIQAKNYLDQYFTKQKPDAFIPKDYEFRAKLYAKFPGNETQALASYDQAIALDTSLDSRLDLIASAAALAKKSGNRSLEAKYLGQAYNSKKSPSNVDLYNWGSSNYQAGQYKTADSIFVAYTEKYPNEIFGYLWHARSLQAQDTAMTQGLAVPAYEKLAEVSRSLDPVKYKGQAVSAYFYLVSYYNDIKKDKATAIKYLDKVLEVDPGNPDAARIKDILSKPPKKAAGAKG